LDNVNNSEQTILYFLELEPSYVAIKEAVDQLELINFNQPKKDSLVAGQVNKILENEEEFLELMNKITFDYDNESRQRVNELSRTEYILLTIALGLLLLEALFIFRPVINRAVEYTKKLIKQEEALKKAFEEQQKEKAKVEYLNKQAESVFENVQQGLFLLDKDLLISELYSKNLEKIFDQNDLGGTSFLKLMKPKLLKRNQEALEIFAEHLFNPKIKEKMLGRLNPVGEVEIYSTQEGAAIETKYLNITFSRIRDNDKIFAVLVTITDVTQSVLMERKIAETEEKNKKDSEQLLSILRVDPLALKDFLDKTKEGLKLISRKYEEAKNSDLRELINFTFNTIHNLKGNASIIDLEIIANKLHDIEELIVRLRNKEELVSKDFLKVLYDINDLNLMVINMQRMLQRIIEVNTKIAAGEEAEINNHSLVEMLDKGLQKLSHEHHKPVVLDFQDHGIVVPERLRIDLKDMLIQLFRNSMAHGIESEEERKRMGKPSTATIKVELAKYHQDDITISYQDDGSGLNLEKIEQKALALGLVTEQDVAKMSEEEISALIFSEGFSTAGSVNEHAGRGQGMQLIRSIIARNQGAYSLSSQIGEYFKLDITLPTLLEPSEA